MGKKKSFIDKKTATTYSLIYRSQEEGGDESEAPERILVAKDEVGPREGVEGNSNGDRWPAGHPLAFLNESNRVGGDARRREIVSLGLPDDGYDYLKHLRVVGQESAAATLEEVPEKPGRIKGQDVSLVEEAAPGPSVFLAATKESRVAVNDVKTMDASGLVVRSKAEDDTSAEEMASGVTAFTKELRAVKGTGKEEVGDVAQALAALDAVEEEDEFDVEALDDEFVLQATEWDGLTGGEGQEEEEDDGEEFSSGIESGDEDDDEDGDDEGIRGYPGFKGDGASLASSYWRKERNDRNEQLAMIDERFERLAFQYDEDQIGDLDEEEGEQLAGVSDIGRFEGILDEFIEENRALMPGGSGDPEKDEAGEAREVAKRFAKKFEYVPEMSSEAIERSLQGDRFASQIDDDRGERWDCESVLSLRSNLDNHPGRINEPRRVRPVAGGGPVGKIKLSSKTGLPVARSASNRDDSVSSESEDDTFSVASTIRRKDETAEEKKARKASVKEAQRQARAKKKELKTMFKDERNKIKNITRTHTTVPLN